MAKIPELLLFWTHMTSTLSLQSTLMATDTPGMEIVSGERTVFHTTSIMTLTAKGTSINTLLA